MSIWNPWHGCHKLSEGCLNCYVYRIDNKHGKDSSIVTKTQDYNLPIRKKKNGDYKVPSGKLLYTCFSSDFLVDDADDWRNEAWEMMHIRKDLQFLFITKRIHRLIDVLPDNWGEGYENVTICCTVENQKQADYRLPIYLKAPIKHKIIICEPLLSDIKLDSFLDPSIKQVIVGGESGNNARTCNYDWVLHIRQQCIDHNVPFRFKQTGANFLKDAKLYHIKRQFQHSQARKAAIDFK
ncbi:DUF5131 family protein [Coprobacter tertius]|uniref:Phage Gp37/Gp68 family protein n=1 Tax=Coprobacter tertius TaxID=2944915 RepID=A0ABT1ML29_9BACT|nr:DUF5131 family protein [Coprobacter tertius]MCP9612759.1 phage Gp37/Gp68 family protein [Coprobacter tertius]